MAGREALLIANGAYDSPAFRPLRSPRQDCEGLAAVLGDPAIGGFGVERLVDATSYEVRRALERFFRGRGRDDVLLLHLSCHGIKDDEGHLHFAASDTDKDLPASTAVSAAFLHELMERCRARTIVVLLDCCYSGAFLPGAKGDDYVGVKEELSGRGRVILTATNRTEYAWEGERLEAAEPQPSCFTGALIEGLRTGEADTDRDGRITVTELYDYVYARVRGTGAHQTPRMWADVEHQVFIARAAGHAPAKNAVATPAPEPEVERAIEPQTVRSGLLSGLRRLSARPRNPNTPVRRPSRGKDAMIRLNLDLAETALGTTKEIDVETAVVCGDCRGEGTTPGTQPVSCPHCNGKGVIAPSNTFRTASSPPVAPSCLSCERSGLIIPSPCSACAGEGRVRHRRPLALKIPAGVRGGTRIKFDGYGDAGPGGGPAADLYVEINELRHPELERLGDDLHLTRRITRSTAHLGGTLSVCTLEGMRKVRIPQNSFTGRTLRLPGLGATHLGAEDGSRGDLLIHLKVEN
jgi:molecular chaperone DnaJ